MRKATTTTIALLALLGAGACSASGEPADDRNDRNVAASPAAATPDETATRIEEATRSIDRGVDLAAARQALADALADPALTPDERTRAVVALSRAHEALGDHEAAIRVVEEELAAHAADRDWSRKPCADRLRALLGAEGDGTRLPARHEDKKVAPFAKVLARYFPPDQGGKVSAKAFVIGGNRELSDALGTFDFATALERERDERCPLCTDELSVNQSTRQSDWLLIPELEQSFADALLVFYFDLGNGRIPARYEAHLPMKVADVERELAAGRSFAVAGERPGAPPVILLAAPRTAMLADVEKGLSQLETLPTAPVFFTVPAGLQASEIRATVRAHLSPAVKACYDVELERDRASEGKIVLGFAIGPDGKVESAEVTREAGSLDDALLVCVREAAGKVVFAASGSRTTVKYPFRLTPG